MLACGTFGTDLNCSESKGATASPVLLPRDGTEANSTPHRPFLAYPGGIASQTPETNAAKSNRQLEGLVKTAAVPQSLRHGGDDAWSDERAADPLHCPWIDSEPFGNDAHTGPSKSRQGLTDSLFQGGGYRRPPEAVSLT